MTARIYKWPARNCDAAGHVPRATGCWNLAGPTAVDPNRMMGWTSSADTKAQVRLSFATKEEAVAFTTRHGIAFRLEEPQTTTVRPKSYAENFKFGRPDRWTH